MKIATHNSITGEEGGSFLSKLLTPFARCQSKTLIQQFRAGCRMFDIRFIEHNGEFYGAHGLWRTKAKLFTLLNALTREADCEGSHIYIGLTYEGKVTTATQGKQLTYDYNLLVCWYASKNVTFGPLYVKYTDDNLTVDWQPVTDGPALPANKQGFLPLNGKTWHTYLPIPWLWNRIYTRKHRFNDDYYLYVDFL